MSKVWQKLKERFSGMGMVAPLLEGMLPQLREKLEEMQRPESEGGILLEGEQFVSMQVMLIKGEPKLLMCAIAPGEGNMIITRTLSSGSLTQMLEDGSESSEETTN